MHASFSGLESTNVPSKSKTTRRIILPPGEAAALGQLVRKRGHEVVIFTSRTAGPLPGDLPIAHLPNRRLTNHGRNLQFAADLANATNGRFDPVVGFDKLSGVDVVYCADPSIAARTGLRSLTPRHPVP